MSADGMVSVPMGSLGESSGPVREMTVEEQAKEFTRYHPATGDQIVRMAAMREATGNLLVAIVHNCPRNMDRSAAIRKARECLMTANASIVLPPLSL